MTSAGAGPTAAGALAASACLLFAGAAHAYRFELGELDISLNNELTLGAGWRVESRDPGLVSKLNNNPRLCPDDCLDLGGENGNPAPNQRLVDAPGGFVSHLTDDGNLNYDKWDMISGQARLHTDLTVHWKKAVFQFTGLGFYDAVNSDLEEYHPDNYQDVPPVQPDGIASLLGGPSQTAFLPRHTDLPDSSVEQIGHDYDVLEAFFSVPFRLLGQQFTFSLGEQRLHWGEALFNVLGSVDQLNPVNQNRLYFPGTDIAAVFEPTGLAVLNTQLTQNLGLELVYQYDWEPSQAAADGSFFNVLEAAGGADTANVSLGQLSEGTREDGGFTSFLAHQVTSTTAQAQVHQTIGQPEQGGQYGGRLSWYLPDFNGGTELNFYALNYHSRLPVASTYAADRSCTRDTLDFGGPGVDGVPALDRLTDLLEESVIENLPDDLLSGITLQGFEIDDLTSLVACGGFNGDGVLASVLQGVFGPLSPNGPSEPIPVETTDLFLDYPEDIHMFGMSFNSNVGKWAVAGEYAFRPNQPLQVQAADVAFASLQPALPEEDINVLVGVLPSARHALPDIVQTEYRDDPVQANEYIPGYERFKVHTADLTGLRVFGPRNWVGADQVVLSLELGMTYVMHMPSPQTLPLESGDLSGAHPSPGADGTGEPDGEPDPRRLNPTQKTDNFPTAFSTGYRALVQLRYSDLLPFGWTYHPQLAFLHDIHGTTPLPIQNYVEDRKQAIIANQVQFSPAFTGTLTYQAFWDGGDMNNLHDRDNVRLSFAYSF